MMATIPDAPGDAESFPGLAGLLERYDPLFENDEVELSTQDRDELLSLSRVFDLAVDEEAESVEIWRKLRPALTRRLPETDGPEEEPDAARAHATSAPLTILVVEDDDDAAQMLVQALAEVGHSVVGPIASAEAAAVVAGLHTLDVALLDINLQGEGNGGDLARKLQADWNVPTIFLSGDVARSAQNADSALAYILKPYRIADVLRALDLVTA